MRAPKQLSAFLEGPLADANGGSDAARRATEAFAQNDRHFGEEPEPLAKKASNSFVLRGGRPLFSYQAEICELLTAWSMDKSLRSALVSLPTGGGKTRTGLWHYRTSLAAGVAQSLLWVAPSTELVRQAVESLQDLWARFPEAPDVQVSVNTIPGNLPGGQKPQACFVTAQLAARRINEIAATNFDLLVFDEAHQALARTFSRIVTTVLKAPNARVLGLTATPGRHSDGEGDELATLFASNLITSRELGSSPVDYLVNKNVLSRLAFQTIDLPSQWEQIRVRRLERPSLSIDELATHPARFWATVRAVQQVQGKCLVFCASLAHCYSLSGALRTRGIESAVISHNTPKQRRSQLLQAYKTSEKGILLNVSLLAEGFDCPAVTDVVLATPIRSPILWEQIIGRASRGPAVGGSAIGRIWELDDHRAIHRKVLSYARYLGDLWA